MFQKEKVLEHLKSGKTLTPFEALNLYGSLRLSSIIFDLRNEGYNIESVRNKEGKPYFIYRLVPKDSVPEVPKEKPKTEMFETTPWGVI